MERSVDLVVVGGGMAGLVAAVHGAELGLKVAVLEKGATDRYPCNTRMSGGIIHIAYNDVKAPGIDIAGIVKARRPDVDPALADALGDGCSPFIDWLRAHGARFVRPGPAWQNWTLAPPRAITAGIDYLGRGPDILLRDLGQRLAQLGGTLLLETRVTRLRVADGRVIGVEAEGPEGKVTITAKATAICDGGFQADLDTVRQHISAMPERLKQRGAGTAMGDGMRMAVEIGAAVSELSPFYGHLLSRDALTNDKLWPYPEVDAIGQAGILVGPDGRRFVDEGNAGVYLANAVARRPDPLSTTLIFDHAVWETAGRAARIPPNPLLAKAGATIHRADTVAAVAALAGLPAETLSETVAAYNAAADAGTAAQAALDTRRTVGAYGAAALKTGPFYAMPLCAGVTYTMGGLRIDADARVLKADGAAIPGLYAAGASTGGIEGGDRSVYMGGLAKAGVFGLRAAEHVAQAR
ncbi:FAD-dependent oxidoreductase [Aquabacter sp. CN5-332]|uniref:FAD-dependent oxidoreductase n=1 Tax=Aquabacter sp. CN5-332 TaxID=3156608 RepID=UPI0032B411E7